MQVAALLRRLLFFYRSNNESDGKRLTAFGLWVLRGNGAGRKGQVRARARANTQTHMLANSHKRPLTH